MNFGDTIGLDAIYTPLDEAIAELHRRQHDMTLRRAVEEFTGHCRPAFLSEWPLAILVRAVFSADFEFERFVTLSRRAGLQPRCLEIAKDRFVSFNRDKYCRGKLTFRWGNHLRALRAFDFLHDGKPFNQIHCLAGYPVVEFHHRMLAHVHPQALDWIHDFSDWIQTASRTSPRYLRLLALAIRDGILFENFLIKEREERRFVEERVLPSFQYASRIFGVKPLIVRLFDQDEENNPKWSHYPGELYQIAKHLLTGGWDTSTLLPVIQK